MKSSFLIFSILTSCYTNSAHIIPHISTYSDAVSFGGKKGYTLGLLATPCLSYLVGAAQRPIYDAKAKIGIGFMQRPHFKPCIISLALVMLC